MLSAKRDQLTFTRPKLSTRDSGSVDSVTVTASRNGKTVPAMKATGKTIELMDKASSLISMEMFTRETGSTIRQMVKEYTSM